MAKGIRLDQALVQRGLFPSRHQAQSAIMAGEVRIDGRVAAKASDSVLEGHEISVAPRSRYVGRGGIKLEGAIAHFGISSEAKVGLDIGASTGGFTDCLLQHGARKVFAVDVGHGQFAWKIRDDPRVIIREKMNARHLSRAEIPEPIDLCVIDVSFISLTLILPNAFELLTPDGVILALIKPQFELAREGRRARRHRALDSSCMRKRSRKSPRLRKPWVQGWRGLFPSSITGTDGNQEFFICLRKPLA